MSSPLLLVLALLGCGDPPAATPAPPAAAPATPPTSAMPERMTFETPNTTAPTAAASSAPAPRPTATDPWADGLRAVAPHLGPERAAALEAKVVARSAARTAEAEDLLGARMELAGALLGDLGVASVPAELARLRAIEERSLRADREFGWAFLDELGPEGRQVLVAGGMVDDLVIANYQARLSRARTPLPYDLDGDESAAAWLAAARQRLAAAAWTVDRASAVATKALDGLDPSDKARRAAADARLAELDTAILDFQAARVRELVRLRERLGAKGWNALARAFDLPTMIDGVEVSPATAPADSLAAAMLGSAGGATPTATTTTQSQRRAWEVPTTPQAGTGAATMPGGMPGGGQGGATSTMPGGMPGGGQGGATSTMPGGMPGASGQGGAAFPGGGASGQGGAAFPGGGASGQGGAAFPGGPQGAQPDAGAQPR